MTKIGITGLIGSGKSLISKMLAVYGVPVFDADSSAKTLMNDSDDIKAKLIGRFGADVVVSGKINKPLLSQIIFGDESSRLYVNSVVHASVIKSFLHWCDGQSAALVAIESALLFEAGIDAVVDKIIFVSAPEAVLIDRIMRRDKVSSAEAAQKVRVQKQYVVTRSNRVDYTIDNAGSRSLILQMKSVMEDLRSCC